MFVGALSSEAAKRVNQETMRWAMVGIKGRQVLFRTLVER